MSSVNPSPFSKLIPCLAFCSYYFTLWKFDISNFIFGFTVWFLHMPILHLSVSKQWRIMELRFKNSGFGVNTGKNFLKLFILFE